VFGLPLHLLVMHLTVVAVPLAALLVVLAAVVPRLPWLVRWSALMLSALSLPLIPLTENSDAASHPLFDQRLAAIAFEQLNGGAASGGGAAGRFPGNNLCRCDRCAWCAVAGRAGGGVVSMECTAISLVSLIGGGSVIGLTMRHTKPNQYQMRVPGSAGWRTNRRPRAARSSEARASGSGSVTGTPQLIQCTIGPSPVALLT
jgi:hypothetical protein